MTSNGLSSSFKAQLFINNEYVDAKSGESFPIHNPHDESVLHPAIPIAGTADIDAAVDGAHAAFKTGPWRTYTAKQRAAIMNKFADLMEARADELGQLETLAMGQPAGISGLIVRWGVDTWRYYAGWADKIAGQTFPEEDGTYRIVRYEPLGVCAGVGAWNASPSTFAWKCAPALAAGNTVIYKSSEKSPLGILALGDLIVEAGFPPGVIQLVSGPGWTGSLLAHHNRIAKISFTGSAATGRKVQAAATASNMKRVTLELGGKSPALVFADADLDGAVAHCSAGFLLNSGQVCIAASRTFVHEAVAEAFVARLKAAFEASAAAMRDDPASAAAAAAAGNSVMQLGPLADRAQFERVMGFIERGRAEAEILTGGGRVGDKGLFVEPTIFVNPKPDAEIWRDEIFGPVSTIKTFKTEEEAVELANDTTYGLSANIYTSSVSRALRVSSQLEAGTVGVNASFLPNPQTPFGGYKQSGQGRELGYQGLLAYLDTKTIHININA